MKTASCGCCAIQTPLFLLLLLTPTYYAICHAVPSADGAIANAAAAAAHNKQL